MAERVQVLDGALVVPGCSPCPGCSATTRQCTTIAGVFVCQGCGGFIGETDYDRYRQVVTGEWSAQQDMAGAVSFDIAVMGHGRRHGWIDSQGRLLQVG